MSLIRNAKKIFTSVSNAVVSGYLSLTGGSMSGALNEAKGTDIVSASTTNIGAATGNLIHITGTTTITAFDTVQAGTTRKVIFDGVLTLTHNATSLILPGGANITTAAGDSALFVSEGSGNWKCMFYQSAGSNIGTWSPSWTGFSANPTTNISEYSLIGDICTVWLYSSAGTSNATTLTVTLPFSAKYGNLRDVIGVTNNATNNSGLITTAANSNIATCFATTAGGAWTASSTKTIFLCGFTYRIA